MCKKSVQEEETNPKICTQQEYSSDVKAVLFTCFIIISIVINCKTYEDDDGGKNVSAKMMVVHDEYTR